MLSKLYKLWLPRGYGYHGYLVNMKNHRASVVTCPWASGLETAIPALVGEQTPHPGGAATKSARFSKDQQ